MKLEELLRELRLKSHYPETESFSNHVGIPVRNYRRYEEGLNLPPKKVMDLIVRAGLFDKKETKVLLDSWNRAQAKKYGIDIEGLGLNINVEALSETIQKEIDFEVKRGHSVVISPRTHRVCVKRIAMVLKDALGIS